MELALSAIDTHSTKQSSTQRRSLVGYVINTAKVFLFSFYFFPFACEWERAAAQIQTTRRSITRPFSLFFFSVVIVWWPGDIRDTLRDRDKRKLPTISTWFIWALSKSAAVGSALSHLQPFLAREICCWMRPSYSCWLLISYLLRRLSS